MNSNNNNDEDNSANASNREIGFKSNLESHNSYNNKSNQKDASVQMDNNYPNEEGIEVNVENDEEYGKEDEEEDDEDEEEEKEGEENNFKNNLVPMENFSQQVDFLFHPNDPEWQTRSKPLKPPKKKKNLSNNKSKNKSKSKSKNKRKNRNRNVKKKQKMKFVNKIRPEFNLCTRIDPQPKTQSIFYSRQIDETRVEKQRRTRAEKIAEYEENYARQKEIYKAKRKKEEEDLRKNYIKSRTSNNFYHNKENPKDINNNEFLYQFKKLSKIDYPETDIRKYECNPQKYDSIIHSLLKEISEIKFQREKENEEFVNKIKKLQNDVDGNKNRKKLVKNRPKSGSKVKINKRNSNNVINVIKNYHKQFKPRSKTGNKFKSSNIKSNTNKKENEIPVNNSNASKTNTKNNFYQAEKEKILKNIQELEMEKNRKINELMNQRERNDLFNNENEYNNNNYENIKNNFNKMNNYPKRNISRSVNANQNVMNLNNNIVYNPIQFNIMNNLNPNALNYQDKIQVLNELNNNIGKFTSAIPNLVNKVNEALNKIYGNTDNPIKNAINKNPLVIMASKATHKMIKSNIDDIIERLIEDLLIDCVYDLNAIDYEIKRREERKNLSNNLMKTFNNLNLIYNNEVNIGNN